MLVIYPYVVEGGFTVVSKSPDTGLYDAHFGMVLTQTPRSATKGYECTDTRPPQDGEQQADEHAGALCRAALGQQRPWRPERSRAGVAYAPVGPSYHAPVMATYDPATASPAVAS